MRDRATAALKDAHSRRRSGMLSSASIRLTTAALVA
jgi:hypothetical protein